MLPREIKQYVYKERSLEWQGEKGRFYLFDRIQAISALWSKIPKQRLYLQLPYLQSMEKAGLKGTKPYYGLWLSEKGELCAVIYCQLKEFKAVEAINWPETSDRGHLKSLRSKLKRKLAEQLQFLTLVVGNLSMSGPFGQWIESGRSDQRADIIMQMSKWAFELLSTDYQKLKAILLKDYYQPLHPESNFDFAEFEIQPMMELRIRKRWETFSDYVAALRSKYRVRYRKAIDNAKGIIRQRTDGNSINENTIHKAYALYLKRANASDFNIATLEMDYFLQLCHHLGEKVIFQLYYHEDELVGFMCMIHDDVTLDAQFTGYGETLNRQKDIYLNLLYDVISVAIELKVERVCFARTALEIKSSVGAVPRDLYCYLYYDSGMGKLFIPSIVKYLEPKVKWNQRHPFKEEFS